MKRNKNKKIVLASTIVLGIAAITSSALAAYIITGGKTEGTANVKEPTEIDVKNNIVDLKVGEVSGQLLFYPEAIISDKVLKNDEVLNYINEHKSYHVCGDTAYLNISGENNDIAINMYSLRSEKTLVDNILALKAVYLKD